MIYDPETDLNTFQMRLTLEGGEHFIDEILVDGNVVSSHLINNKSILYVIDPQRLVESISKDGEFYILTCGCGEPSCAGLHEGIYVSHLDSVVSWRIVDPKPVRVFRFDENQYFASIVQFFRAVEAVKEVIDEYNDHLNIGPYGFSSEDFADCFRYLESLMDDEGNLIEPHLRQVYQSPHDRMWTEERLVQFRKDVADMMLDQESAFNPHIVRPNDRSTK